MVDFDNSYARLPDRIFSKVDPDPVPQPEVILFNTTLAHTLGVSDWAERADILVGNCIPAGAEPLAQVYAAHQFGGWVPRLGDGRAILLGEVVTKTGRFDIQLKGAGRTPYSRNGDGRNWLGPVLREYIVSEFMAAMDVPTTRALAATATGARVQREVSYPGGVITRIAASHIRVGTFQYFTAQNDLDAIKMLIDHVRERHFPQAKTTLDVYDAIIAAQAKLVAKWMGLGFVHGVMNTDNMAISGETIDYGPCAFIDGYASNTVFSSIDRNGRYAFDQQSNIAGWNLAQLGSCFVGVLREELGSQEAAVEMLTQSLNAFPDLFQSEWRDVFAAKLGIAHPQEGDLDLAHDLLQIMQTERADFTNVFAGLSTGEARNHFINAAEFDLWAEKWQKRIVDLPDTLDVMADANPKIIPRTHRLEHAIQAAIAGDYAPAQRLAKALSQPKDLADENQELTRMPEPDEVIPKTFCGT
jgi:uncharacterized protein YdiU (UPF0061 family)